MSWARDQCFEKITRKHNVCSKRRNEISLRREQAKSRARSNGCVKLAYASKSEAETAMARFNSGGLEKQMRHAYRCPRCQAWHLTSKDPYRSLPTGPCGKVVHVDYDEALALIPNINAYRKAGEPPVVSVYYCSRCRAYHHSNREIVFLRTNGTR